MKLQESAENYLEAILLISRTRGMVRAVDIAAYLNFSKPSVSRAVRLLREGGHILVGSDGAITLTEQGRDIAEDIYNRHTVLSDFLVSIGVDEDTAKADACKIEHVISKESFVRLETYMQSKDR